MIFLSKMQEGIRLKISINEAPKKDNKSYLPNRLVGRPERVGARCLVKTLT